jgi:hypothetical protein
MVLVIPAMEEFCGIAQAKREDPISKISNTKRTGRVAQVVECLPSKHKALSANPCTTKKK